MNTTTNTKKTTPSTVTLTKTSNVTINLNPSDKHRQNRSIRTNGTSRRPARRVTKETPKDKGTPVRIIALGGLNEVGANMMMLEYKNDIIIVDCGMLVPGDEMFGVDYIIPDMTYLKKNKHKIRGIFITHGHLDHIGAVRHALPDLDYPPVYGTPMSIGLMKRMLLESPDKQAPQKAVFHFVDIDTEIVKAGVFTLEFFRVNHSIPESMGMAIHTPNGLIVNTGDFKIDFTPDVDEPADLAKIARIGKEGVKLLLSDSTNSQKPGRTPSEKSIGDNFEYEIKHAQGRLIIAMFSSMVGRLKQIIDYCVAADKIVFLSGRSMVNNIEVAKELGYIKAPKGYIRKINSDIDSLPDDKVVVLTTGSQGEEFATLPRIARGEHQFISLRDTDRILISASTIPGNENAVSTMMNKLIRQGANVITTREKDLHVSGHGYQEDQKLMLALVNPEYFIPVHGELYMRNAHRNTAIDLGIDEDKIFTPDNGQHINVYKDSVEVPDTFLELDTVMIDGNGIGTLSGEYVMKARQIMAHDGMVSLIFKIDADSRDLIGNIQIESRGFVYSSEVKRIHTDIVTFAKKKYYSHAKKARSMKYLLKNIKEDLEYFLRKNVGREPLIITSYVYINTSTNTDETSQEYQLVGMTIDAQGEDTPKSS